MMKITGLDDLQKHLEKLTNNAESLNGMPDVPLDEFLDKSFLQKHTQFSSLTELIENSDFDVQLAEDFKAIPDDDWDQYIGSISKFPDWTSMISSATQSWTAKKLGFKNA